MTPSPADLLPDPWNAAIEAAAEIAERYRLGTLRLHEKAKTEKRDRLSDNHEGASDCAEEIRDAIRALCRPAQPSAEEIDWHVVGEALCDAYENAEGYPSEKELERQFTKHGLIVSHKKE